ncbi:MAG TPA: AAA family ATPase [Abditibacteriaceae bacterium]|jgi:archaellum biogenesis ATPase FlaH
MYIVKTDQNRKPGLIYKNDADQIKRFQALPDELKTQRQWVIWSWTWNGTRWTKPPLNPTTGKPAKTNDPSTWGTFDDALAAFQHGDGDGLGFVFNNNNYTVVDYDDKRNPETGDITEKDVADELEVLNSFTEISPTGTGFHCIMIGTKPEGRCKDSSRGREMYSHQFIALTGHVTNGRHTIEPRQEHVNFLHESWFPKTEQKSTPQSDISYPKISTKEGRLDKAFASSTGGKIRALFEGTHKQCSEDRSAADMSLANSLAFYANTSDELQTWMQQSALYRPKWDETRGSGTYLSETCAKAFRERTGEYDSSFGANHSQSLPAKVSTEASARLDRPSRLLSLEELQNMPSVQWLVDEIIPKGALGCIFGPSGEGKTFVALDLALSVSAGVKCLNRESSQGQVVYIAAEGTTGLPQRIEAWKKAHSHAILGDRFHVLPEDVQLSRPEQIQHLEKDIATLPERPALIVVDTMARCLVGQDENSAKDVGAFVAGCDALRKATGTAILIVHHTDKSGNQERGSTALRAACDTMVRIKKRGDGTIQMSCEKQKDAGPFTPETLRLLEEPLSGSCFIGLASFEIEMDPVKSVLKSVAPQAQKIFDIIQGAGDAGISYSQIGVEAAVSNSGQAKSLNALEEKGLISQNDRKRYVVAELFSDLFKHPL